MDAIREIKMAQAYLTQEISRVFDGLIQNLQNAEDTAAEETNEYEAVYPLSTDSALFKGRRPTCVLFGDKRSVANTWKNVFKLVILECNSDTEKHKKLMELRNKVLGRDRILLSDGPGKMYRPFQIDKKLYVETHYDTESLLRILLHRILDEVGFDYGKISVGVKI